MPIRKGIIEMGAGAAFIGLGLWGFSAGTHEGNVIGQEQACATAQYKGNIACKNVIPISPSGMEFQTFEAWAKAIAGVISVGSGVNMVADGFDSLQDPPSQPNLPSPPAPEPSPEPAPQGLAPVEMFDQGPRED